MTFAAVSGWPQELRLAFLLAMNATVICGALRFLRRRGINDRLRLAADTLLTWYFIQYISVGLCGLIGLLSAIPIAFVATSFVVVLNFLPTLTRESIDVPFNRRDAGFIIGGTIALVAFIIAILLRSVVAPPIANDAITYHLPAAAQWIQTGRIGLYQTWFFNSANTFSPLAGSIFIAWLMAPLGNDALARFVESPAVLLILFALIQIVRSLRIGVPIAILLAFAACVSRPIINQTILAKDDLFVTAFFISAIAALEPRRLNSRLGIWRLGISIGLLLATKYTALMILPLLVFGIEPKKITAKNWFAAAMIACAIAAPWFVRNFILTRNPLFPIDLHFGSLTILNGQFTTRRSNALGTVMEIWSVLTGGYSGLTNWLFVPLIFFWIGAIARYRARLKTDPLFRVVMLAPPIGIFIFAVASPFAEVRFVYPMFVLLFAAPALAMDQLVPRAISEIIAACIAIVCVLTSFIPAVLSLLISPLMIALPISAIAVLLAVWSPQSIQTKKLRAMTALTAILIFTAYSYVSWVAFLSHYRVQSHAFWTATNQYGNLGNAWEFVRDPQNAIGTVAYTNTPFTYLLMGFDLDRRVIYVPTRGDVSSIRDLGHAAHPLRGEEITPTLTAMTQRDPDRQKWLMRLQSSGANTLFIARSESGQPPPPEMAMTADDPRFKLVFGDEKSAVLIYRIDWSAARN